MKIISRPLSPVRKLGRRPLHKLNSTKFSFLSHGVSNTLKIGHRIARHLKIGDIVCLFGQLGSGKTVLTKAIAQGLGVKVSKVISPSFILIREHKGKVPFYHFDLYRLNTPRDILALGYEEYFYNDGITVIEWADRLRYLLPTEYLKIELSIKPPAQRLLRFSGKGAHYKELLRSLEKIARDL